MSGKSRQPKERDLALTRELCRAGVHIDTRQYALSQLAKQPLTLLGLKAVISCLLKEDSPLKPAAEEYLRSIAPSNAAQILAVAFRMAQRSESTYKRVASEIIGGNINLEISGAELRVWRNLNGKSWSEIVEALGSRRLDIMPKDNPTLRYCRWVMENPTEDDVPAIMRELLDLKDLSDLPLLRRALVSRAVHWKDGSLIDLVHNHRQVLSKEIEKVVCASTLPSRHLQNFVISGCEEEESQEGESQARNWVHLVDLLVENLQEIPNETERQAAARSILEGESSGNAHIRNRYWDLCRLAGTPELAVEAVVYWETHGPGTRLSEIENAVRKVVENASKRIVGAMPPELQAKTLQTILETGYVPTLRDFLRQFVPDVGSSLEHLHRYPHLEAAVSAVIQGGYVKISDVADYLRRAPEESEERRWQDLQEWLLHRELAGYEQENVRDITQWALRRNMAVGCLLSRFANYLAAQEYELKEADLLAPGVWESLVAGKVEPGRTSYKLVPTWFVPQWRQLLLLRTDKANELVGSYLATLEQEDDREYDELLVGLLEACEQHEEIRTELLKYAAEFPGYNGNNSTARRALADGQKLEWLRGEYRERLREVFRDRLHAFAWKSEKEILHEIFSPEERRELFLAADDPWMLHEQWEEWYQLFRDGGEQSHAQFMRKLNTYTPSHQFTMSPWLMWIDFLALENDPRIRLRIERFVLEGSSEEVRRYALRILTRKSAASAA